MDKHYLPIKKRYYVISTGGYGGDLCHFQDLDSALEMFKYLQRGNVVGIKSETIKTHDPNDKEDGYNYKYYNYEEKEKPEYHLESKTIETFTLEQIKEIEKIEAKKLKEVKKTKKK